MQVVRCRVFFQEAHKVERHKNWNDDNTPVKKLIV